MKNYQRRAELHWMKQIKPYVYGMPWGFRAVSVNCYRFLNSGYHIHEELRPFSCFLFTAAKQILERCY